MGKRKPIPVDADYGPPERHQHGGIDLVVVGQGSGYATTQAARNRYEHVLDRYVDRGMITSIQHEAGIRFCAAYQDSENLWFPPAMDLSRAGGGQASSDGVSPRVVDANNRLTQVRDITTPEIYGVIVSVCGLGNFATYSAPRNKALDMLREGLDVVIRAWRMGGA